MLGYLKLKQLQRHGFCTFLSIVLSNYHILLQNKIVQYKLSLDKNKYRKM